MGHTGKCGPGRVHDRRQLTPFEALLEGAGLFHQHQIDLGDDIAVKVRRVLNIENQGMSSVPRQVHQVTNGPSTALQQPRNSEAARTTDFVDPGPVVVSLPATRRLYSLASDRTHPHSTSPRWRRGRGGAADYPLAYRRRKKGEQKALEHVTTFSAVLVASR